MSTYKTSGIILRRSGFGEASLLLYLYTKDFGKIEVVARSACKARGKLKGLLEPSLCCDFVIAHGRKMDTLTNSFVLDDFLNIRQDTEKTLIALSVLEIVDKMTISGYHDENIFYFLYKTLELLDQDELKSLTSYLIILLFFEINFLYFCGFRPQMEKCVFCGNKLFLEDNKFSFSLGGVIHNKCSSSCPDARVVDSDSVKLIRFLEIGDSHIDDFEKEIEKKMLVIRKLQVDKKLVFKNIFLLKDFITFNLDKNINSFEVLYNFARD